MVLRLKNLIFQVFSAVLLFSVFGCEKPAVPEKTVFRAVSLAPNLTEIIVASGGLTNLVGRSAACDYPPEVKGIPVAGNFGVPFIETILTLKPDIVLDSELERPEIRRILRQAGIRSRQFRTEHPDDIPKTMREIGTLLNCSEQADREATVLETFLVRCRQTTAELQHKLRVLVIVWNEPLMTLGERSFLTETLALAGGTSIGAIQKRPYYRFSVEWAVRENPDLVLFMTPPDEKTLASLKIIQAVRDGRYAVIRNMDALSRPGPRIREGILELQEHLSRNYPSVKSR